MFFHGPPNAFPPYTGTTSKEIPPPFGLCLSVGGASPPYPLFHSIGPNSLLIRACSYCNLLQHFRTRENRRNQSPIRWSIREVIGHLIDGERVFGHRAFCFSRGELAHLPSFDENEYVAASRSNDRTLADLVAELALVRQSHLAVFERLA